MISGITIAICCHNSASRLPETLRHLSVQEVPEAHSWEVILIDNASTDFTAELAMRLWSVGCSVPLRVVSEPVAGLSHARFRAFREARYEIVSFIDDDNWIAPNWVARVAKIFDEHPKVGVCGGRSEAICEVPPPIWFEEIKGFYAVGSQHPFNGDITDQPGTLLWGAGLTIRKHAMLDLFSKGFQFLSTGRKTTQLLAGEDSEMCFALRVAGWKFWYDERLSLRHYMPATRLTWAYARKLMRGMGYTSALLDIYLIALGKEPFNIQPPWKHTWLFQYLKTAKNLCMLSLFHPLDCLLRHEGGRRVLELETRIGRNAAMLAVRNQYIKIIKQIRSASVIWETETRH